MRCRRDGHRFMLVSLMVLLASTARADEPGLSLTDLGPYRAAIEGKTPGPAVAVTFRELWDHPDRYQGKRVRVEGRVARRFRQEPYGTFPALVEAWAVGPSGDPFCLVFPSARDEKAEASPGASVRFEGTFLRRVRYQGGDVPRLAPLIVGDRAPVVTSAAPAKTTADPADDGRTRFEWGLGLAAAGLVALALARQHLRVPPRKIRETDPPPEFVDQA